MFRLKDLFKRKKISKSLLLTTLVLLLIFLIFQPNLFWTDICGQGSGIASGSVSSGDCYLSSGITGNSIKWSYNTNTEDPFLAILIMNNSNEPKFRDTYNNLYDTFNDSSLTFFATLIHPNFSYSFLSFNNLSRSSGNWKVPYYDIWHMIFFNIDNVTYSNFLRNVCFYITELPNFRFYSELWFLLIIGGHISVSIDYILDKEKDIRKKRFWIAILGSMIMNFILLILFTFLYMNYELSLTGTGQI